MPARQAFAALSVAAVLAAGALTGCGGDSSSGATTTATAAGAGPGPGPGSGRPALSDAQRAQFDKLRTCLKQHGADIPTGPQAGGGPPQIDEAALKACSKYFPQGGPPGAGGPPPASP